MDIYSLQNFLNSMSSYSADLVQHLGSGAKLCHYTTLEGALGMIEGGDIWLSHLRFSNDDEELRYGQRLVRDEISNLLAEVPVDLNKQNLLSKVQQRLAQSEDQAIYICCFCEVDNLLSQWRGYADNGGGVSIEFDPELLRGVSGSDVTSGLSRLWRVFYNPEQQKSIVRKCIDYPYWPVAGEDERVAHIVEAIQFFMPTFKNQDFSGERERRLIFTPGGPSAPLPKYRVRSGMVVPYVCLNAIVPPANPPKLPILAIKIGPGRHRDLNKISLGMALAQKNYTGVPVTVSTTPYRS